jgi:hypothetical protein
MGRALSSQVFTLHNEHVLDQVLLQQGTYTNFRDTTDDPNPAVRAPGDMELLMRRVTVGDNLLMTAMHDANLRDNAVRQPSDTVSSYWERIWIALLTNMWNSPPAALLENPRLAAATAYHFVSNLRGSEFLTQGQLSQVFMTQGSRFYTGVVMRLERLRERDTLNYVQAWVLHFSESRDHLFMTATIVTLYALDNYARDTLNNPERSSGLPIRQIMEDFYRTRDLPVTDDDPRYQETDPEWDIGVAERRQDRQGVTFTAVSAAQSNLIDEHIARRSHDNQETDDDTEPRGIPTNRLLP